MIDNTIFYKGRIKNTSQLFVRRIARYCCCLQTKWHVAREILKAFHTRVLLELNDDTSLNDSYINNGRGRKKSANRSLQVYIFVRWNCPVFEIINYTVNLAEQCSGGRPTLRVRQRRILHKGFHSDLSAQSVCGKSRYFFFFCDLRRSG